MGVVRNSKFGLLVSGNKSQRVDDKSYPRKGRLQGHVTRFKIVHP